jgi:predicted nucleic acid-binding protein
MSYLIDTNVLSELRRKQPNSDVVAWVQARPASTFYISVLTLGELRKGIASLGDSEKQQSLLDWLEVELPQFFMGRVLPIDAAIADRWGGLVAQAGRPVPAIDSLLAATALVNGLQMVTRNHKDFAYPGLQTINPWQQTN